VIDHNLFQSDAFLNSAFSTLKNPAATSDDIALEDCFRRAIA
jgi:hypothetical protein